MEAKQIILSRGLPKTSEIRTEPEGCDGYYQAGWWVGQKVNGHKTRFIAKTIDDDEVVIDLATGLMWAADGDEAGCGGGGKGAWEAILNVLVPDVFAGFNDWRVPNINELLSIVDYVEEIVSIKQPPFSHTKAVHYWSSTTYHTIQTQAWGVDFSKGRNCPLDKTSNMALRCVRLGV